jgi:hypothetical protein
MTKSPNMARRRVSGLAATEPASAAWFTFVGAAGDTFVLAASKCPEANCSDGQGVA